MSDSAGTTHQTTHAAAPSTALKAQGDPAVGFPLGSLQATLGNRNVHQLVTALSGAGEPLDDRTLSRMGARFGSDLRDVRLHREGAATEAAASVGARAYALGTDIAIPRNAEDEVLAHELHHSVAQRALGPAAAPRVGFLFGSELTDAEKLDKALKSRDPSDVKDIDNVYVATEPQRIDLLKILLDQWWVGPRDETKMEQIWGSFGTDLPKVMSANRSLWTSCIDRGAELENLAEVKKWQVGFLFDVQSLAFGYLAKNREYIEQERARLGIGQTEPPSPEQESYLQEVTAATAKVKQAQDLIWDLRLIPVGERLWSMPNGSLQFVPWLFNADVPPDRNLDRNSADARRDWHTVNAYYRPLAAFIQAAANQYPTIYAAIQQSETYRGGTNKITDVTAANPTSARLVIGQILQGTLDTIARCEVKIGQNDPDYRDLVPIHTQLLTGAVASPSGTDWQTALGRWVIADDVKSHKAQEFWIRLGLKSLAAAAIVVAEISTIGTATFFIAAGAGLGISGGVAIDSYRKYASLEEAAKSNVKSETALVDKATVQAAGNKAIEDAQQFFASVAVLGVKALTPPAGPKDQDQGQVDRNVAGPQIAARLRAEGKPVVVNIGGTGAPHEPADAINLNPNVVAPRKNIPNLIQAPGETIGSQFEAGSVDRVVGNRLPPGTLDYDQIAQGSFKVLKPGGTLDINIAYSPPDAVKLGDALQRAGFVQVKTFSVVARGVKP